MPLLDKVKQLREETAVSLSECKKALEESGDNIEKAKELLRKWGKDLAGKKASREVKSGIIDTYLHPNKKVGVMLDIRCESDFVAKGPDFQSLAHEICLQIAAMKPKYIKGENIPEDIMIHEKQIYLAQFKESGKPKNIIESIIEGKLKKYRDEVSLLSQPWVKDSEKTIKDLIDEYIAKLGENIVVLNFVRYDI